MEDPEGLTVLEQNFRNDLAFSQEALARHVGQSVAVATRGGRQVEGTLLSFQFNKAPDNSGVLCVTGSLVIAPAGGQTAGKEAAGAIDLREVRSIRFARLAEGLLTKPRWSGSSGTTPSASRISRWPT